MAFSNRFLELIILQLLKIEVLVFVARELVMYLANQIMYSHHYEEIIAFVVSYCIVGLLQGKEVLRAGVPINLNFYQYAPLHKQTRIPLQWFACTLVAYLYGNFGNSIQNRIRSKILLNYLKRGYANIYMIGEFPINSLIVLEYSWYQIFPYLG